MGVLDEAIRDHLELRRRHGASDAEIARAEAEALGPARRDPAAGLFADGEPVAGDDETTILDPVVEEELGRAAEDRAPPVADSAPPADPTGEPDGATAVYDLEQEFQEPPIDSPPVEDEPPVEDAPVEEPPPLGDEPAVEDEPPLGDEPRGHQTRPVPPRPLDDPEDESEPPPPAFPRPYNEP